MSDLRLLAVQHEDEAPLAWLGQWWAERGIGLDVVRADLGEAVPARVEQDGLVVLGGYMGATDDAHVPWLAPTRDLIRATVEDGIPVLGVCLGHQLMAVALGGEVRRNPAGRLLGLLPVALTEEGRTDPLLSGSEGLRAIHYNEDVVTVAPHGAAVLATAPDGTIQALRFAERAWGVQFHPEISPELFDRWLHSETGETGSLGATAQAVADEVAGAGTELRRAWQPMADRFATVLGARLGTR